MKVSLTRCARLYPSLFLRSLAVCPARRYTQRPEQDRPKEPAPLSLPEGSYKSKLGQTTKSIMASLKNSLSLIGKKKKESETAPAATEEDSTAQRDSLAPYEDAAPQEESKNKIVIDTRVKYWYYRAADTGRNVSEQLSGKIVDYLGSGKPNKENVRKDGPIRREIKKVVREVMQRVLITIAKVVAVYELGRLIPLFFERCMIRRYKKRQQEQK